MFITANKYFTDFKFSTQQIGHVFSYSASFLQIITLASMIPTTLFNWINCITLHCRLNSSSSSWSSSSLPSSILQKRKNSSMEYCMMRSVIFSISIIIACFVLNMLLAAIDTHIWPETFFGITIALVVISSIANGIYQNIIMGICGKLPSNYMSAIILGNNLSGIFVTCVSITTVAFTKNLAGAAVAYFFVAVFILFCCGSFHLILSLNKFYKYHCITNTISTSILFERSSSSFIPFNVLMKSCFDQFFNIFFVMFVTLACFPSILANVQSNSTGIFHLSNSNFREFVSFLNFNICTTIGVSLSVFIKWPGKRVLRILVLLRCLFIPYFLFCNYQLIGKQRIVAVQFYNNYTYWAMVALFGLSNGYLSNLSMTYVCSNLNKRYASTAMTYASAFLSTGVLSGILFSFLYPHCLFTNL